MIIKTANLLKKISFSLLSSSLLLTVTTSPVLAQWATSGTSIYNTNTGYVGIGTSTPVNMLTLQFTGNDYLSIGAPLAYQSGLAFNDDTNGQDSVIFRPANGRDLLFWTATSGVVGSITQAGNFGIGTSSPTNKLTVSGNANFTGYINSSGSSGNITTGTLSSMGLAGWGTQAVTFPTAFSTTPNIIVTHDNSGTGDIELDVVRIQKNSSSTTGFTIEYHIKKITTAGTTKFNWLAL